MTTYELQKVNNTYVSSVESNVPMAATIDQAIFNAWIEEIKTDKDNSQKTIDSYKRSIRQFEKWLSGNQITQPGQKDIKQYRNSLGETHKATTVNAYMAAVRRFFSWTKENRIYEDVAEGVKGISVDGGHSHRALTANEAKSLVNTVGIDESKTGPRDAAIITLMLTSGLRTIEIVRANLDDLDKLDGAPILYVQGKGRKDRKEFVRIENHAYNYLMAYLASKPESKTDSEGSPLFVSDSHRNQGGRLTTKSISRLVKDHLRESGTDSHRVTAHSLRHTAACLNMDNGGTLEETQHLLRHKKIDTTMIYLQDMQRVNNRASQRIGAVIFD